MIPVAVRLPLTKQCAQLQNQKGCSWAAAMQSHQVLHSVSSRTPHMTQCPRCQTSHAAAQQYICSNVDVVWHAGNRVRARSLSEVICHWSAKMTLLFLFVCFVCLFCSTHIVLDDPLVSPCFSNHSNALAVLLCSNKCSSGQLRTGKRSNFRVIFMRR